MPDLHIVRKGDTLGRIAKHYRLTVSELQAINQLRDINKLTVGQRIRLNRGKVLGVQALVLDRDRNPIPGLAYQLEFAGRLLSGVTDIGGLTRQICTATADDQVRILVQRFDQTWKEVARVSSGYGNKLVTLVSPSIKVEAKTEPHPLLPPGQLPEKRQAIRPLHDTKVASRPLPEKKAPGLVTTLTKTVKQEPLVKVEGDVPELNEFLDHFNGEFATDADYEWAAKELNLEVETIKAFAIVESGAGTGGGFIQIGIRKVPTILYERHKFSKFTQHVYGHQFPDISLPVSYYNHEQLYVIADDSYKRRNNIPVDITFRRPLNSKDGTETRATAATLKQMLTTGLATIDKDTYARRLMNYKRLIKAYKLNSEAALKSCSWGAFQIMGQYWNIMGYKSITEFTHCMSRSEHEQLKAFILYLKNVNPQIASFLRSCDWEKAARAYNGTDYKKNKYDIKLESKYKELKSKT